MDIELVWQMSMPEELTLPVQRVLRTMISGIMLVQCFTVYVYLASYIVLLYPVFLEERPTLLLPWLLLAAIRKLLCELTSLALGLGTCVLLGPARPPCIKFVVIKVISIMPSFYMWMLVYSYYHALKVVSVFKTFPPVLPSSEHDYGLELAIRRRRAKSLQGEDQLRKSLISNFYNGTPAITNTDTLRLKTDYSSRMSHATDTSAEDLKDNTLPIKLDENPPENENAPVCYEDWLGSEVMIPRDTDRILEQFGVMMLRISAFLMKEGMDSNNPEIFDSHSTSIPNSMRNHLNCTAMPPDNADTPPLVANSGARKASYLRDYPHIFQKKADIPLVLGRENSVNRPSASSARNKNYEEDNDSIYHKWSNSLSSDGSIPLDSTSSKISQINEIQQNGMIQHKTSEKGVVFLENKKHSESKVTTTIYEQKFDPIGSFDNCAESSKESLKSMKKERNIRHRSRDEKSLNKDEIKTSSNQTLNESKINIISSIASETNNVDKATSTKRVKKKTKEQNKNIKK